MANSKKIILIAGPTAVGKTAIAIQLAEFFHCPIISADSRQCFRELNIGVAKPSPEELRRIPHYFINSHSIFEDLNAAIYEQLASQWAIEIFKTHDLAIMVGGTGLYIKAFCEGLDEIPAVPEKLRADLRLEYENHGLAWLQQKLRTMDPEFFQTGEIQNPQRLLRALEVSMATGRSLLSFRRAQPKKRAFVVEKYGISLPKERLHQNIHFRVDDMMARGLLREVEGLLDYRSLNALQTVGYAELFSYLDGAISLDHAIELIKKTPGIMQSGSSPGLERMLLSVGLRMGHSKK